MPNRTIYLTKEQNAKFTIAQSTAKALGTSVGAICAAAIENYVDETQAAREIIKSALGLPPVLATDAEIRAAVKGPANA